MESLYLFIHIFCFSVSLTSLDGYKIVYSGDTRPSDNLISLGLDEKQTDLLIHEATMAHYMLEDCKVKRHTTFTEAIEVAQKMNAKNAIMTHFSQRYSKIPPLDEFEVADNVGIGKGNRNVFSIHQIALRSIFENLVKWQQDF